MLQRVYRFLYKAAYLKKTIEYAKSTITHKNISKRNRCIFHSCYSGLAVVVPVKNKNCFIPYDVLLTLVCLALPIGILGSKIY